ncbi:MAG: ParB N-terminal domain-containing protein [Bacteroidetes bacterium]|nr:ParB N-terminal domain-containing protein [Bacteroidota bacterium]MBT7040614.1 ParB N-terminal domain-containing protein [Bacteroidota bacterium]
MKIINKKINEIIPYHNNPRINDGAVNHVASSIKEFGFKVPIVIDDSNVIVTGHTRLKAALKLGLEEVPCIKANDLTPAQIKAFRIADNKTSDFAIWDFPLLDIELAELKEMDFDYDFGFEDNNFEPGTIEEQSKLDELEPKIVKCPHCGEEFDTRETET